MYRIYINETALIIADFIPQDEERYQQIDVQTLDFKEFYKYSKKSPGGSYLILSDDPKGTFRKIRKPFVVIKAAGGVVRNERNEYLFIFRKGKWDLPKGKLDESEKSKKAAEREVEEECGIKVSSVGKLLCKSWHVYDDRGQIIFKRTSWYKMKARTQKLVPQLEEDITEARWLGFEGFGMVKKNTFPIVRNIINLMEV